MSAPLGTRLCILTLVSIVWTGQTSRPIKPAAPLSFEVASIRPVAPPFSSAEKTVFNSLNNEERQMMLQQFRLRTQAYSGGGCHGIDTQYAPSRVEPTPPLGRCAFTEVSLHDLIVVAYGLEGALEKSVDVKSGWWSNPGEMFDVQAKAEDPLTATEAQLRIMLQSLLTERFKLLFHREARELPGYALVVDRGGPKFKEARIQDNTRGLPSGQADITGVRADKYSMQSLSTYLTVYLGRPVLDKTDLPGLYGIALAWQAGGLSALAGDHPFLPDLPSALKEQLGLRLDAQKVPVDFIVVDSAEKPIGN